MRLTFPRYYAALTAALYTAAVFAGGAFLSATTALAVAGVLVAVLYASSVSFTIGHAGVAVFGNQAFYGTSAYLAAWLAGSRGVHDVLLLLLIGLVAGACAAGLTVTILHGDTGFVYGMLSLAIAQGLYLFANGTQFVGGTGGLAVGGELHLLGVPIASAGSIYWVTAVVVGVMVAAIGLIRSTAFGITLSAARQNSQHAAALGVPLRRYKGAGLIMGGAGAGVAGVLFVVTYGSVDPSILYFLTGAVPILAGVLGGLRTFAGPIVGAVIYQLALYLFLLHPATGNLYIALVIMGIFLLVPEGIIPGTRRLWVWMTTRLLRNSLRLRTATQAEGDERTGSTQNRGAASWIRERFKVLR
jgi:branched-chain amino acid transport system permease protein